LEKVREIYKWSCAVKGERSASTERKEGMERKLSKREDRKKMR
jgi:hypothetical protein